MKKNQTKQNKGTNLKNKAKKVSNSKNSNKKAVISKSKLKTGESIYITSNKERYVYYNPQTKKRIYAKTSTFRNIREFKAYIQGRGYVFGSRAYKQASGKKTLSGEKSRVKIGKYVSEYEVGGFNPDKPKVAYKNRFRLFGKCIYNNRQYFATSSIIGRFWQKSDINDLKNQVFNNITEQIFVDGNNTFKTTKDLTYEIRDNKKYAEIYSYVENNTKFSIVYSKENM